ncbi:MAG: hypothetical protein R6U88_03585 [Candidatus Bipolaricaulota bacterium]
MRRAEGASRPLWWGLGRDLVFGAVVGAVVGVFFEDAAFGAGAGAAIGGLLHVYLRLR